MRKSSEPPPVNVGRHEKQCAVCLHPDRLAIEQDFVAWKSPGAIADEYELRNRASVYRHAHAFDLFGKRRKNIRAALEKIIEGAGSVDVTAASVVQAVGTYTKINSEGRLVERSERVNLNEVWGRMSEQELLEYAESGQLPDWFGSTVGDRR